MNPANPDSSAMIDARTRFVAACRGERVDRPPVWMRGACGTHLPDVREALERDGYDAIAADPERAATVALAAFERYAPDGVSIFGDGEAIAAAMGIPCARDERGRARFPMRLTDRTSITALDPARVDERFAPLAEAARTVRAAVTDGAALLGFALAPFSLAARLVEGSAPASHVATKSLFYTQRETYDLLAERLVDATIRAIHMQVAAGVDAIAIEDPSARALDPRAYWYASGQWIRRIVDATPDVPKLLWSTGSAGRSADLRRTRAEVLAIDDPIPIARFHDELGGVRAVEGNLDPEFLALTPDIARDETRRMLDDVGLRRGFVANVARPLPDDVRPECVAAFVDTVKAWRSKDR